jgi:hypothetical protein
MPGIKNYSFGDPTGPNGMDGAFFCFFIATFESVSVGAIKEALASPAGKRVVADIPNYSPDPSMRLASVLRGFCFDLRR